MASFGFSVGDFVAFLSLVRDISQALKSSTGSVADYKAVLQTLNSLNQTFTTSEVVYLQCQSRSSQLSYDHNTQAMVNGMLYERQQCRALMEQFLKASTPYTNAFLRHRGNAIMRSWRQVTWLSKAQEINKLDRGLQGHMRAMQVYSDALFQNQMTSHTETMDSHFQCLISSVVDMRSDISALSHFMHEANSRFPQSLGYPWEASSALSENVLLFDANGRSLLLPILFLSSPEQFHELLGIMYRGIPGHRRIVQRQYSITDESSDGVLVEDSDWNSVIRAGIKLSVNIVLQASPSWKAHHCPRCAEPTLSHALPGKRRRCHKCQLTYSVFDRERIVEEADAEKQLAKPGSRSCNDSKAIGSYDSSADTAISRQAKNLRKSESVREDYYFRRVHYHREVQKAKQNFTKPSTAAVKQRPPSLKIEDLPPLHRAAATGSVAEIEELLEGGADINAVLSYDSWHRTAATEKVDGGIRLGGCSPLHLAALFGHTKAVQNLLGRGADISAQDWGKAEPLSYVYEDFSVAILLIARGANPNSKTKAGHSFIFNVCNIGTAWVIDPFIRYGGDINMKGGRGETPLQIAARSNYSELVELLLEKGSNVSNRDVNGHTPLYEAAVNGNQIIVEMLLDHGADPNTQDKDRRTPLYHASWGHKEVVEVLLKSHAQLNLASRLGVTPLHRAAKFGSPEIVELLINHGAVIDAQDMHNGTALHFAYAEGHLNVVRQLLKMGADAAATDEDGKTVLAHASILGHMELAQEVLFHVGLEASSYINKPDLYGQTPLYFACWKGHDEIAKRLIESGAESNTKELLDGLSPLHIASFEGHVKIAGMLIKHGGLDRPSKSGCQPLHLACIGGHDSVVSLLIESGVDIDAKTTNSNSTTALHITASENQETTASLLLQMGIDPNVKNSQGDTALHVAASLGHFSVVRILLDRGVKLDTQGQQGYTALIWAAFHGRESIVRVLVENRVKLGTQGNDGHTALILAAFQGHKSIIQLLIDSGAKLNTQRNDGNTAIMLAAFQGHESVVRLLIDSGAKLNTQRNDGNTALMLAAFQGHESVVRLLIDSGTELNTQRNDGNTALMLAALQGHESIVRVLVENRVKLGIQDNNGHTALILAAFQGHESIVRVLVKNRVKLDTQDQHGNTALMLAALQGHESVVRLIIDSRVELETQNNYGNTALMLAVFYGHESVVRLLIDSRVKLDTQNNDGNTVLMLAAFQGHKSVVRLLIDSKVRLDTRNDDGNTALDLAAFRGNRCVVRNLIDNGAKLDTQNNCGITVLHQAAVMGHVSTVQILLYSGAKVNVGDSAGLTELHYACAQVLDYLVRIEDRFHVVELLLDNGSDPFVESRNGLTPSLLAESEAGLESVAAQLRERMAAINK